MLSNKCFQVAPTIFFEFGQATLTDENYRRDHHPRCFTVLFAGAGVRYGTTVGATDESCYNITDHPVHVHDLNATILHLLHLMGVDHTRLTCHHEGRDFRLTDIHGEVVNSILS